MAFLAWLRQQAWREDCVGEFARYAHSDKAFPHSKDKLYIILLRYQGMPVQRESAKAAHREWRRNRSQKQDAVA